MAAPPSKTLRDLSGKWSMNKDLSSDPTPVLELQGFNVLTRKAAAHAPITLSVTQDPNADPTSIEIDQKTAASIPAIKERWTLDWEWREQDDAFLGKVKSRSRWQGKGDVEDGAFLTEGLEDEEVVDAEVESLEGGWKARQCWGFGQVGGERKLVRRVVTTKGDERVETVLVYDFES